MVPLAAEAESGSVVRVRVAGLADPSHNPLDSSIASAVAVFGGERDTTPPAWTVVDISDSLRGWPPDRPLRFTFSKPVERRSAEQGIQLCDSSGKALPRVARWDGPAGLEFSVPGGLAAGIWHEIRVTPDSLRDLRGHARRDSTRRIRFETLDMKRTGSIEGWVRDSVQGNGRYVIIARSTGTQAGVERRTVLERAGQYQMTGLPEGMYAVWAFRDADSSGVYSAGRPFPFRPSEPFIVLPETVKVRARWGVEGAGLDFR